MKNRHCEKKAHTEAGSVPTDLTVRLNRRRFLTRLALGAGLSPFLSMPGRRAGQILHAQNPGDPPQNLRVLSESSGNVLKPSDFTYLGAMRLPADLTSFGAGPMTARKGNGRVRFFITGPNTQSVVPPDVVDAVYEIADTGVYNRDYRQAPRANVLTRWGDIYRGKRMSWDDQGNPYQIA